jgi:hypothetical protein
MNTEASILISKLIEHYDAVELLRQSVQVILVLTVLLLIQTSRAAFHRGKREAFKAVLTEMQERIDSHCEEITWHRDNAERLEARLFKEPLPAPREEAGEEDGDEAGDED